MGGDGTARSARGAGSLQALVGGGGALLQPPHALRADRFGRVRPGAVERQAFAVVLRLGGELLEVQGRL
jgi:hypothetical protein